MEYGKGLLLSIIFSISLFFAMIYYFPPYWSLILILSVGVYALYTQYRRKNYKDLFLMATVLGGIILLALKATSTLTIYSLSEVDVVETLLDPAFEITLTYYLQWGWFFILFMVAYLIIFMYAVITHNAGLYRGGRWMAYIGVLAYIIIVILNMILAPGIQGVATIILTIFSNVWTIPWEAYYAIQIAVWIIAGFIFITSILGGLTGESEVI